MRYVTIKLTEDQARYLASVCELDQNPDYPKTDKHNAFIQRIIDKLAKAKTGAA